MKPTTALTLLLPLLLCCACSASKSFGPDQFAASPNPLECVAGQVPATIQVKIPPKFISRDAVVTFTPVLRWAGGEARGESLVVQGERVEGTRRIISNRHGATLTLAPSFPFQEGMERADLYMDVATLVGEKAAPAAEVKIGHGTRATARLLALTSQPLLQRIADPALAQALRLLQKGQLPQAEQAVAQAAGADGYEDVIGLLYLAQGKYGMAAVKLERSGGNSAILADILAQDYAAAKRAIAAENAPSALTTYLQALLAVRQGDEAALRTHLASLKSADPALYQRAQRDVEFENYATLFHEIQ